MLRFQHLIFLLSFLIISDNAFAHPVFNAYGSFYDGLFHPITGLDHLLAIFFAGILASQEGKEKAWRIPALFIGAMTIGSWVGVMHIHLPLVEVMISLSLVAIGVLLTAQLKISEKGTFILISFFAFFHGHAHGMEASSASQWLKFGAGFILATAALLAGGYYLGRIIRQSHIGSQLLKYSGMAVALIGISFLTVTTLS